MAQKNSFLLYQDYREHLALLSDEELGQLLLALFDYAESKRQPENLSSAAMMAFSFIRAQMDRDEKRYEETCETNQRNGAKGGRPSKAKESEKNREKPKETDRFFEKPKKPDNDNDTDNDTDTDIEKEKEIEKKPTQEKYGEFQNVKLTGEEHRKLVDSLGERDAKESIERLSPYLAQTGKRYKNHYATILNWNRRDGREKRGQEPLSERNKPSFDLEAFERKVALNGMLE